MHRKGQEENTEGQQRFGKLLPGDLLGNLLPGDLPGNLPGNLLPGDLPGNLRLNDLPDAISVCFFSESFAIIALN